MYPEVQEKARKEIGNLRTNSVRNILPPTNGDVRGLCGRSIARIRRSREDTVRSLLMKELWRWRPPVALGHPHTTTRELTYNGYRIPKGSRLHINA